MLKWWKTNKAQFYVVGYLDWQILGYCRESNWIEWIFSIALGFNRTPHMINLEFLNFESKCIDFQELIEWFALRLWMIYNEIFWKLWGHQGKFVEQMEKEFEDQLHKFVEFNKLAKIDWCYLTYLTKFNCIQCAL
jgi:hypothetical protein